MQHRPHQLVKFSEWKDAARQPAQHASLVLVSHCCRQRHDVNEWKRKLAIALSGKPILVQSKCVNLHLWCRSSIARADSRQHQLWQCRVWSSYKLTDFSAILWLRLYCWVAQFARLKSEYTNDHWRWGCFSWIWLNATENILGTVFWNMTELCR